MKKLMMTLMTGLMALGALADLPEVLLNQARLDINSNQIVVVRTAATPDKIHLNMMIPISRQVCVAYDTRQVWGADPSCGSFQEPVTRCESPMAPSLTLLPECHDVCNSQGCHSTCYDRDPPGGGGGESAPVCHTEYVTRYYSCYYPETYCSQYGTQTDNESRKIKLVFRDVPALKEGETEKFVLTGAQGGGHLFRDSTFTLEVKESAHKYTVKEGVFYNIDPRLIIKQLP